MKKSKKIGAIAIVLVVVMAAALAPTFAGNATKIDQTVYLKGTGTNFNEAWNNVFYVGSSKTDSDPNIWHLVYSGKDFDSVTTMQLTFTNGEVFNWSYDDGPSVNGGYNNPGWVVYAPCDWQIAYIDKGNNNKSESFLNTSEPGNGISFNISGFHQGTPNPPVTTTSTTTASTTTTAPVDTSSIVTEPGTASTTTEQTINFKVYIQSQDGDNGDAIAVVVNVPIDSSGNIQIADIIHALNNSGHYFANNDDQELYYVSSNRFTSRPYTSMVININDNVAVGMKTQDN